MDRALKERLVGAIVLIVATVLVVPVFLDGPAENGEQTSERVTLPGQNNQPHQQQTIVLERDRDQPVPAAAEVDSTPAPAAVSSEPAAATRNEEPAPQKSNAAVEKVATNEAPAPASRSATEAASLWAVQLGSFSNRANAEKLAADLRAGGYAAFLSGLSTGSGELHRVRVGPQKDRESAEGVASALQSTGHKGQVVTHP